MIIDVIIDIFPKKEVLNPETEAVKKTLSNLGYKNINELKHNLIIHFSSREEVGLGSFAETDKKNMIMSFFGSGLSIMSIQNASLMSIGFSIVVVVIAALNLVLDFDFIEQGSEQGAPKYMEWYGAFGLLVTLIWLYLEILRLLAKLQSRRN